MTAQKEELRLGVIGAGGRGWLASAVAWACENAKLVAGADTNPEVAEKFHKRNGADAFFTTDYREVLARDDVQAVFVSTPDFLHEEHALAAIEAGKHVYLEKPMAITTEGCDRILRAAREAGVKLYLGHNMRHMAFVQKMKELIDSGAIGQVMAGWCRHFVGYGGDAYFKDWHAERAKSTSLLLQKGAHDIDVLHWLCGGFSRRVNAMGGLTLYDRITDRHDPGERGDATFRDENWPPLSQKQLNPVIDVEDISMMQMRLDNGVFASYQQCHYTPDSWRNYTVIGAEGRIENFGNEPGNMVVRLWNRRCRCNEHGDEQFFIPPAGGGHGGSDDRIVAEFVAFVRGEAPATTSPLAGRYAVAAGCAATESLREGGIPVDVPPVDEDVASYFE